MASTNNPMSSSTPAPDVSKTTLPMSGLLCDVYGLEELIAKQASTVSCLWLHHPRLRAKEDMADFASRVISQWEQTSASESTPVTGNKAGGGGGRALIAVAFDQQNHGTRTVSSTASDSWREGNATHALDMWAMVSGMVSDTTSLIDVVEGYLKLELARRGAGAGAGAEWAMDQHLVLGVSLGGHSAWQTMFREKRVSAGVVIIGCPDYMALLSDRAKKSKLATFSASDDGASFLGSKDFPSDLVASCLRHDPKGILFGTGAVPASAEGLPEDERRRLGGILDGLGLRRKRFLVCSGAEDKLVPYKMSEPFVEFFAGAAGAWYADRGVVVENKVYDGVGHAFSEGMVEDSVRFLVDAVAEKDGGQGGDERRAKI
ncbi:Putative alpha/Beta hydrolase [Colletotrichum destructivum]|uniref:Alpha/Beta hydrolase n=1 Tax=Colletotrichum destructivum TaxID=34406 RepID=A0AAX4IZ09_9PEZI|nr:Putative alpha/Beta hydrolase [Colletotrichum destructivum]